ncbi:PBP1A family penicillin-binding protein [Ureibacillus acetophenoni]|uniref:Penicillin-binding protein 1A n=1 Tax=Ureibacillus acetophenoni TaxID=614649 RepID=A0A285U8B0_9BACL|nr:penicillin-binding protein 1A [Ureibacillus acetophenoni]
MAEKRTREELKRERAKEKRQQKKPVKSWIKRIILSILAIGLAGFIFGVGLFVYYASSAPELNEELLKDPISAEFYDKNGELFAKIGVETRKYVKYEDIPQDMVDAILATEDVRFFDHFGVDVWRTMGAVLANFRDGFGAQGGSTITQQVVKNSFLSNDKALKRKAQEAWLAVQLEQQYDKEEIFEMYFNKILMSGRIYGFGTAAEYFFGKELNELELDEMALLAGMPQSPNRYNPFKNPERAQQRRDLVLDLMVLHEKITKEEAEAAKQIDVTSRLLAEEERQTVAGTQYDAFLDIVQNEIEANGDGELLSEGIKVYTTLDPNAQTVVENVMNNPANFPTETIQSGVAVIDTKTGAIRAIGGGRDFGADRSYNFADDLKGRSPGSTMKPLLDYGPAFEHLKWSTGQTIVDDKITYTGSNQAITNWDNKYLGTMTVREALYTSRNVPAVKTLQAVGQDKATQFISKLGIETDGVFESDAIGGGKVRMTPIQMAASYAAFGNNGVYNDPHAVTEIVYRDGSKKTYENDTVVAMQDYTAYMVTDILRDAVSNKQGASASRAGISGLDVAGKSGTTNYSSEDFAKFNLPNSAVPDAWFAGYTTNYSIAIWSGYRNYSDPITTWDERFLPQTLFKTIMSQISANVETPRFSKPSTVVEATIEVGTDPLKLASEHTPDNMRVTELFVKGTEPTEVSDKYKALELDAPSNLQAIVNEAGGLVDLMWEYTPPTIETGEDEEGNEQTVPISFEVSMSVDDGESIVIGTTDQMHVTIPNLEYGRNYTFSVVAVSDDVRSDPATVSTTLENPIVDPEIEDPTIEDPEVDWENDENNSGNPSGEENGSNEGEPVNQPNSPNQPNKPGRGNQDNND